MSNWQATDAFQPKPAGEGHECRELLVSHRRAAFKDAYLKHVASWRSASIAARVQAKMYDLVKVFPHRMFLPPSLRTSCPLVEGWSDAGRASVAKAYYTLRVEIAKAASAEAKEKLRAVGPLKNDELIKQFAEQCLNDCAGSGDLPPTLASEIHDLIHGLEQRAAEAILDFHAGGGGAGSGSIDHAAAAVATAPPAVASAVRSASAPSTSGGGAAIPSHRAPPPCAAAAESAAAARSRTRGLAPEAAAAVLQGARRLLIFNILRDTFADMVDRFLRNYHVALHAEIESAVNDRFAKLSDLKSKLFDAANRDTKLPWIEGRDADIFATPTEALVRGVPEDQRVVIKDRARDRYVVLRRNVGAPDSVTMLSIVDKIKAPDFHAGRREPRTSDAPRTSAKGSRKQKKGKQPKSQAKPKDKKRPAGQDRGSGQRQPAQGKGKAPQAAPSGNKKKQNPGRPGDARSGRRPAQAPTKRKPASH